MMELSKAAAARPKTGMSHLAVWNGVESLRFALFRLSLFHELFGRNRLSIVAWVATNLHNG